MRFRGDGDVLFATFNQDASRLAIGTKNAYYIYSTNPFRLIYTKKDESTGLLAMLFNTSLVAHVGAGEEPNSTQRCLRMINTKREKEIIRMNYRSQVLNVCMNRQRLVLVLEELIYIYDVANMKLAHVISSTPKNPDGVCALASCKVPGETADCQNLLAYPGRDGTGEVNIYDTVNLRLTNMIEAHTSSVTALAFNNKGTRLATASTKGTVFRIFDSESGDKLYELRRGFSSYAKISTMSFSADSSLLSVSSERSTVHIFKLDAPEPAEADGSWTGYLTGGLKATAAGILPTAMTEIWTQERSFAQATLPSDVGNAAALSTEDGKPVLLSITSDGYLHKFEIADVGGECLCSGKHIIDGSQPTDAEVIEEDAADE